MPHAFAFTCLLPVSAAGAGSEGGEFSRRHGAAASPGARDLSDAEESLPSAGRAGFRSESGS